MLCRVLVMLVCMELVSMRHLGMVRRLAMIVGVMGVVRFSMMMRSSLKMMGRLLMTIMFRHRAVSFRLLLGCWNEHHVSPRQRVFISADAFRLVMR
jgi:hypothetical protein